VAARLAVQAARLPGDSEPVSLVLIDCADAREAAATAKFLRALQNGEATMRALGDSVLFGDTALKLALYLTEETPERVRVVLTARRSPADLTEAIFMQTEIDRQSAETFRYFHSRRRSFVLTMSIDGVLHTDLLYLVKYIASYPWRARLKAADPPPGNDVKDIMKAYGLPGWDQTSL